MKAKISIKEEIALTVKKKKFTDAAIRVAP